MRATYISKKLFRKSISKFETQTINNLAFHRYSPENITTVKLGYKDDGYNDQICNVPKDTTLMFMVIARAVERPW